MLTAYIISSLLLILFSFLVFRVIVRRDYLNKKKLSPLSAILQVLVFAIHANLTYLFVPAEWPYLPSLPDNPVLNALAFVIFGFGLAVLLISWFKLGTETSFGQDRNRLNTSGLYGISRNPQLVGYGVLLFSVVILFFSWYAVGWMILYLLVCYFMVRSEEEFLARQYGDEYVQYCNDVPRTVRLF